MSAAEADLDTSASIGEMSNSGVKVADGAFRRNMGIIGGVIVLGIAVVVGMAFFASGHSKQDGGQVRVEAVAGQSQMRAENEAQITPAMQQMLQKKQEEEAEAAKKKGQSYVPAESLGKTEKVAEETKLPPSTMQTSSANFGAGVGGSQTEELRMLREGLKNQLLLMFPPGQAGQGQQQAVRQRLEPPSPGTPSDGSGAPARAAGAAQSVGTGQTAQASDSEAIVPALEIYPARLANPIVAIKGKSSYASALLTGGPYSGAFMTGTATMSENETIDITYDRIRIGKKAYKVNAKLLDEQTADAGLRGNVDRRILQRYVLPVAVATLGGYFTASAQTGSSVTSGTGGVLANSTPPPSEEQARSAGIAAGMGILSREVGQAAQEPIRSNAARDVPIGIMFLNVVSSKDELK